MNEHAEYFATDQASSSHQLPILLDHKGRANLTTVCNLLFGMEVLEELRRPRRIDPRIANPNGLVYQPHELVEVGVSKPANAYVVSHEPFYPRGAQLDAHYRAKDCFWHISDLPRLSAIRRFRGQSGHQAAVTEQSRFMSTRPREQLLAEFSYWRASN